LINCKTGAEYKPTFLSNNFINTVLGITSKYIINKIVEEIGSGGKIFGISVDTTTDVATVHQTSIVARYVSNGKIVERTIGFAESADGTGHGIFLLIKNVLHEIKLDLTNIVGCSFDGAQNMRSDKSGVYHYLLKESPKCILCWCYAHRFNWCIEKSGKKSILLQNLIALSNEAAVFLKQSSKRMLYGEMLYSLFLTTILAHD
jgi:hypothetical protein